MTMNKKLLFALPLTVFTVACGGPGPMTTHTGTCATAPSIPADCNVNIPRNAIKINLASSGVSATPPNACATRGDDIVVTITPPPLATVTVAAVPKDPANDWIIATNAADPGKMIISVPANADVKKYDYMIVTGDGKCLDPKIHVDR